MRGEPSIEPHFLLAEVPAKLRRAKVDKAELHRLLQLVDKISRQEHYRDVRVANLHRDSRMGIGVGARQSGDEAVMSICASLYYPSRKRKRRERGPVAYASGSEKSPCAKSECTQIHAASCGAHSRRLESDIFV